MDKAAKLRWTFLGTAFAGTVAAILYPVDEEPSPRERPVAVVSVEPGVASKSVDKPEPSPWVAPDANPFAPRAWLGTLSAPTPAPLEIVTVDTDAPEPASAPPPSLPYKFVGQMRDGSATVVYLSLGEQMVLARAGETLDGGYKVASITATQIEFESVALGIRQSLPLPTQD